MYAQTVTDYSKGGLIHVPNLLATGSVTILIRGPAITVI